MSKPDWLKQGEVANVQTAIQSQTIQTALERNVSDLSPQALQSFLTQAPIPRCGITDCTPTTALASVATVMIWPSVNNGGGPLFDPYKMVNLSNGFITCPIDGFYHAYFNYSGTASFSGRDVRFYWDFGGQAWGINVVPNIFGTNVYQGSSNAILPCRAGQVLKAVVLDDTVSNVAGPSGNFSVVWIAPFINYQGGQ